MATKIGLDHDAVLGAAVELADEIGLHELTLAALAGRLGVRTPTLYHYVDGLAGLRRQLAILGCAQLAQRMGAAIMGTSSDEAVLAMSDAYRVFATEHPGLYAATVQAAPADDPELIAAQTEVLTIALRAVASYHLSKEDAIHVVRILRSAMHGFVSLENAGGFGIPLDRDRSYRGLLHLLITGLHQGKLD